MPIEVELPDGNIAEFPDGTDNATMERALAQYAARPKRPDFRNSTASSQIISGATDRKRQKPKPRGTTPQSDLYRKSAYSLGGEGFADFMDGLRHRGLGALHGAAEYVQTGLTNAAELAADKAPSTISRSLATLSRRTLERDRQAIKAREAEYQAGRRGGAATKIGEVGGAVLPYTVGAPAKLGGALMSRLAPAGSGLLRRGFAAGTTGGVTGAAAGLIEPVTGDGNYADQKAAQTVVGGIAGAALGPAAEFAPGAARWGMSRLAQLAGIRTGAPQTLTMAQQRAGEILRNEAGTSTLPSNPSQTPGYVPALGEETQIPALMQIEDFLRANYPGEFKGLDISNNLANLAVLRRMAGTDAELAAAKKARADASQAYRQQAMAAGELDMSQTVRQLGGLIDEQAGRPAVQSGLADIRSLLIQNARKPEPIYNANGLTVAEETPGVMLSPQTVDNVRMTIGDMLTGKYGGESAKALAGSRELIDVRNALVREASDQRPAFGEYVNAFRRMSQPVNQMQVGRRILKKASGREAADNDGNRFLTLTGLSDAMSNIDEFVAKATKFNKAKATDIITPQTMSELNGVLRNLQRASNVRRSNAGGNSATQVRTSVRERLEGAATLGGTLTKRAVMQSAPAIGKTAEFIERELSKETMQTLAYLVANPAEARRVMAGLSAQDRKALSNVLFIMSTSSAASQAAAQE